MTFKSLWEAHFHNQLRRPPQRELIATTRYHHHNNKRHVYVSWEENWHAYAIGVYPVLPMPKTIWYALCEVDIPCTDEPKAWTRVAPSIWKMTPLTHRCKDCHSRHGEIGLWSKAVFTVEKATNYETYIRFDV